MRWFSVITNLNWARQLRLLFLGEVEWRVIRVWISFVKFSVGYANEEDRKHCKLADKESNNCLKVDVNLVKAIRVFGQLFPDVFRADEDALQVRPGALHLYPDCDYHVGRRKFLLPRRHLVQEVRNELGRQHVLQLNLITTRYNSPIENRHPSEKLTLWCCVLPTKFLLNSTIFIHYLYTWTFMIFLSLFRTVFRFLSKDNVLFQLFIVCFSW